MWKMENGSLFMYFSLFFFLCVAFSPEGQVCRTYLRRERGEKHSGGVRDGTEQRETEKERTSESDFFEGLSGRVESKKRKGQEEK